jgi:hypothetical protein
MSALFMLRSLNSGWFESVVRLYDAWNQGLAFETAAPAMKAIEQLRKDVGKRRIKPMDHGF